MLTRFVTETDIDVVLMAGRYTLLDQSAAAALLPAAERRGVSVIAGGVFNSGLLAAPGPEPRTTTRRRPTRWSPGPCGLRRSARSTACRCVPPRPASR